MALSVELNQAHRWFVAKCVHRIMEFYNVANSGEVRELYKYRYIQTMGSADLVTREHSLTRLPYIVNVIDFVSHLLCH